MTMLDRDQITSALATELRTLPAVRAAWLAGSDANGRTDRYSDIDFVVLAEDEAVEAVFAAVDRALTALSPVELKFRLPQPAWPGVEQAFYRLRDAGPHLLVDFAAVRLSAPPSGRFLERERHGTPVVLFDHDGLLGAVPIDRAAHGAKIAARVAELRTRFPMFQTLVLRAIERGQVVDAVHFYMGYTLRPLIDLLRIAHCPDRFDFGPRYLGFDLPPEASAAVARLSCVADLGTLRQHQREAESLFGVTLRSMGAAGGSAGR